MKPIHKIEKSRSILCGQQCQDKQRKYFINFCVVFFAKLYKGTLSGEKAYFWAPWIYKKINKTCFFRQKAL